MTPLRIFIGYDPVESVAYHTLCHSILTRASGPVSITPVNLRNFNAFYWRERDPRQSNEFSFTRFLVPYLCDYRGKAIFMDCDMLVRADIYELLAFIEDGQAVAVVKHDYTPHNEVKYLNNIQYPYPRKNWSSVVVWDCEHFGNRTMTPSAVSNWHPSELHRFTWLHDAEIGEIPVVWNWLVGEYSLGDFGLEERDIKNWHFTVGGPWFHEYEHVDGSDLWFEERALMTHSSQRG